MKFKFIIRVATTLIFILLLVSCNKEKPVEFETNPSNITEVNGSISNNEIGGKELYVVSAYNEKASLTNNGYTTEVSDKGTQILYVIDSNDKLRGLTLSILNGDKPQIMDCDALSTAYSLLFLTPGITTTEPTETQSGIVELNSLATFQTFVNYLKTTLNTNTLDEVMGQAMGDSLFQSVVYEYFETNNGLGNRLKDKVLTLKNQFEVNKIQSGSNTHIELKNWGFRIVGVYKREVKDDLSEKSLNLLFPQMSGVIPISWGSLFTRTLLNPTIKDDNNYNPGSDVFNTEYWIVGPGKKVAEDVPPPSINTDLNEEWG